MHIVDLWQIESRDHSTMMAEEIADAAQRASVSFVYGARFSIAWRTSLSCARCLSLKKGHAIVASTEDRTVCTVPTNVHTVDHCGL